MYENETHQEEKGISINQLSMLFIPLDTKTSTLKNVNKKNFKKILLTIVYRVMILVMDIYDKEKLENDIWRFMLILKHALQN